MRRRPAWAAPALLAALFAFVLVAAAALPAGACPVCYGEAEGEVIQGTQWSVAFLGALVYGLIGGAGAVVLVQRRRLRRRSGGETADPYRGLHRVAGGGAEPVHTADPDRTAESERPSRRPVEE